MNTPGTFDLGSEIFIRWDPDGRGFMWHHTACRAWATLRFMPDPASTGHRLVAGGQHDTAHLSIAGSLLCPMGCGTHGCITAGRWVKA